MMIWSNADAPHIRKFWATRLRSTPSGVVAEIAGAGLDAEEATAMISSEEFLQIILEKVAAVSGIENVQLPGTKLYVLKETSTATTTSETKTSTSAATSSTTATTLPKALLGAVGETSSNLLGALVESNERTVVAELPDGGTIAVKKPGDAIADEPGDALAEAPAALGDGAGDECGEGASGGTESESYSCGSSSSSSGGDAVEERVVPSIDVKVPDTGVDIALPVTMFASPQVKAAIAPADIAMVVTAFDPESADIKDMGKRVDPEQGGVQVEALGAATIDLRNLASGDTVSVKGLRDPIQFSLSTNYTPKCSYWDEKEQAWSTKGVWATRCEKITCKTRQLSLIGVLLETFVQQLLCANVLNLMNAEALQEVVAGTWIFTPSAVVFAGIIALLLLTYVAAAFVDSYRHRFKDKFLLVHMADGDAADVTVPQAGSTPKTLVLRVRCACFLWLQESDVVRQAVDDIASNWLKSFAEIRTAIEACRGFTKADLTGVRTLLFTCQLTGLAHNMAAKMLLSSSRRLFAANLCMAEDVISFVPEDEYSRHLVHELSDGDTDWRRSPQLSTATAGMREEVTEFVLQMIDLQAHQRHGFLRTFLILLMTQNLIALLVMDILSGCRQRVLFEGITKGKAKGRGCLSDDGDLNGPMQNLAQFMVMVVAGLPVNFWSSLQTKKFKIMKGTLLEGRSL